MSEGYTVTVGGNGNLHYAKRQGLSFLICKIKEMNATYILEL